MFELLLFTGRLYDPRDSLLWLAGCERRPGTGWQATRRTCNGTYAPPDV